MYYIIENNYVGPANEQITDLDNVVITPAKFQPRSSMAGAEQQMIGLFMPTGNMKR